MFEIFQYDFIIRGLQAGIIVSSIAPLIGIFLVLRRYSLIADTLSHVSLAGVAIGLLFKINPIVTAILAATTSSILIERLRLTRKVYGETALALFLSGSLALAIILISLAHGFSVDLFNYLFGSIVTVRQEDIWVMSLMAIIVIIAIALFYKELVFLSFDEEAAQVAGIPARLINTILIILTALTVALAIPIVGILLISALIVIPVVAALQLKRGFSETILIAEGISLFSVITGIIAAFYLDIPASGLIVLTALAIFAVLTFLKRN
ncbi:MAG: ABC-3 protein [Microgenomates group bacterium GW2011_GWA1_48_10]|nr:MAG: ABC-3 protein [Microgenomates group bacterium GW2011_GWA1_48_10]